MDGDSKFALVVQKREEQKVGLLAWSVSSLL